MSSTRAGRITLCVPSISCARGSRRAMTTARTDRESSHQTPDPTEPSDARTDLDHAFPADAKGAPPEGGAPLVKA